MNVPPPQPAVLEFPAMLRGHLGAMRRDVRVQGQRWAREYLETGAFTPPQRMLQVPPGEILEMGSGILFDVVPRVRWRIHMFISIFTHLLLRVPDEQCPRMEEAFEAFCLSTPWGALYQAVTPPPPRSAERMAQRFAALLRFWDVLQGPRYAIWFDRPYTLEEMVDHVYRVTLEAWCPGGPASVREHLALAVERMSRATREDCMEAVLRLMPRLVRVDAEFKFRAELNDPDFLRERLAALPLKDFEDFSSAYHYTVSTQLAVWDRELGRPPPHT